MKLQKYTLETELTDFLPLPRSLLAAGLPSTAVLLYGVLLDRATLSRRREYCDTGGWVYVVYPLEELSRLLYTSTRMLKRHLTALEAAGFVRKVRASRKLANQYFLYLPSESVKGTGRGQGCPTGGTNPASRTGHQVPPSNLNKQHNSIDLYQHSEGESL